MISTDITVWIGAFFTIAVISFVFKYNRAFRFAEASGIAVTMGWIFVAAAKNMQDLGITPVTKGDVTIIVPIILGVLLFTRFSRKHAFMGRWGAAVVTGVGIGLSMRGAMETQIIAQMKEMNLPLVTTSPLTTFNNLMLLVLVISSLMYFFFTAEHKGGLQIISGFGRYALMMTFGTMYGETVLGRLSLLIARLQFLWLEWLGVG